MRLILVSLLLLTACGKSSDGSSSPAPAPTPIASPTPGPECQPGHLGSMSCSRVNPTDDAPSVGPIRCESSVEVCMIDPRSAQVECRAKAGQ